MSYQVKDDFTVRMSLEHNIMSQELSELHVVVDLSVDGEDD
jgi:hypothetical protein